MQSKQDKMELMIKEEKENPLFSRKEVTATAESNITPSRSDTLKALAEKFKVPEENIKIKGINGKFGSNTFTLEANIYNSKEEKETIELKKKKDEIKAPEPVAEAEATKPAETTAEAPKEETNPEEKQTEEKPSEPESKPVEESKVEENKEATE